MTVRVVLREKQRGDNHRPEFRPTNSDQLDKVEKEIYRTVLDAVNEIPETLYREVIFGNLTGPQATENVSQLLAPQQELIALAIFKAYLEGAIDMSHRIRDSVNRELKRLRSNLRLVGPDDTTKAVDRVLYTPAGFGIDSATIKPIDVFNQQPDDMSGKVYARLRANAIISSVSDDVQANIATIIADGFEASQTFGTGRTATGLTPEQTARRLFEILRDTSPVPITGADYASYVAPHTNGLFPKWATAVDRSMNAYAHRLRERGISPQEVKERTSRHGERYGNKLRRSRARMIARTEVAFAQNIAMSDMILGAQAEGVLTQQAQKEWIAGPFDVCNICQPMNGKKVPTTQPFVWQGGSGNTPPAHPNCRCVIVPVPFMSTAPNRIGSGTIDDPNRYVFESGFEAIPAPVIR
jgi:hypothetical protein|tara:strand:+ start:5863 stop:7095 length:1233 start_codon:yes stop_codon:yes gene_type:complete